MITTSFGDVFEADHPILRHFEIAEIGRVMHHVHERAAEQCDASIEANRIIDDLLDAWHVRCERRDDDAARGAREDVRKRFADDPFRRRMPGTFGVGGIGEHRKDAVFTDARNRRKVGGASVDGRLVEFEIARVEDRTERRRDRERTATGEAVIDMYELGFDITVAHDIARLHGDEFLIVEFIISHLGADECERERRADDGDIEFAQQVGNAADVIFVAVRDEQRAELVLILA
jgi:hypothetical protein